MAVHWKALYERQMMEKKDNNLSRLKLFPSAFYDTLHFGCGVFDVSGA